MIHLLIISDFLNNFGIYLAYLQMKEALEEFLIQIIQLGGGAKPFVFSQPATEDELDKVENQLGYKIPADFRNTLKTISSHCEFNWFLPDGFELPNSLRQIFCGDMRWGVGFILPL